MLRRDVTHYRGTADGDDTSRARRGALVADTNRLSCPHWDLPHPVTEHQCDSVASAGTGQSTPALSRNGRRYFTYSPRHSGHTSKAFTQFSYCQCPGDVYRQACSLPGIVWKRGGYWSPLRYLC